MNLALMLALARMRLASPMRIALVVAAIVMPMLMASMADSLGPVSELGGVFAVILSAGLIGQDVSRGLLQATLVRPVTRAEVVLSRWFAAGAMAAALGLFVVAATTALLMVEGTGPAPVVVWTTAAEVVAAAFGTAAAVTLWSSVSNGLNDIALLLLARLIVSLAGSAGGPWGLPWLTQAMNEVDATLLPVLKLGIVRTGGTAAALELVTFVGSTALLLALAITCVNRREYTYAAD